MTLRIRPTDLLIRQKISVFEALRGDPFEFMDRAILATIYNNYQVREVVVTDTAIVLGIRQAMIDNFLEQDSDFKVPKSDDEYPSVPEIREILIEFIERNDDDIWIEDEGNDHQ